MKIHHAEIVKIGRPLAMIGAKGIDGGKISLRKLMRQDVNMIG